jgi:hypothetical protein
VIEKERKYEIREKYLRLKVQSSYYKVENVVPLFKIQTKKEKKRYQKQYLIMEMKVHNSLHSVH